MKRVAFWLIALLLTATVLAAVAITKFPDKSKSDYSANFASSLEAGGWTPIKPISQIADDVYSGSYRASSANSGGNGSVTLTVTIAIAQSEAAAKKQYGQLVLQKQNDGS